MQLEGSISAVGLKNRGTTTTSVTRALSRPVKNAVIGTTNTAMIADTVYKMMGCGPEEQAIVVWANRNRWLGFMSFLRYGR